MAHFPCLEHWICYRFAEAHNCSELAEEALEHAQANWNVVANGDELLDLPLPQLVTLLSSEQLKVESEAQVANCCVLYYFPL